jgi:hypothetical protein
MYSAQTTRRRAPVSPGPRALLLTPAPGVQLHPAPAPAPPLSTYKVTACSNATPHDRKACPFVHPGEPSRRRPLSVTWYEASMCPYARRGEACPNGDTCGKVWGRAGQRACAVAGLVHCGPALHGLGPAVRQSGLLMR